MSDEYCPHTGKRCYSERQAKETINFYKNRYLRNRAKSIPKRCYKCQFCGTYHLTHLNNIRTCKASYRRYGNIKK